jgi:hypothetical protein
MEEGRVPLFDIDLIIEFAVLSLFKVACIPEGVILNFLNTKLV